MTLLKLNKNLKDSIKINWKKIQPKNSAEQIDLEKSQ